MTGPNRSARRRAPDATPLLVPLDASDARALHRQVYDGLRDAIVAGRLAPGARLPSTRTLAADLGVARNTVTLAFEQLRTEGYVAGKRGGGTRVRDAVPDALLEVRGARRVRRPAAPPPVAAPPARLSTRGAVLAAAGAAYAPRVVEWPIPFRIGTPATELFPAAAWARLTAREWRRGVPLGEGDAAGELRLRAAIAEYVVNARGARCTADQVVVLTGTQQAVDLAARVLADAGDAAWVEDPGYARVRVPLVAAGVRPVPVPVDGEGLVVAAGERAAPLARLAHVTPSHQFPLGAVLSAPRRLALLAWARRAGAWIIEDDYDSEFRYAGRPLPCLQGLDDAGRVLYVGTFSKTLAPGLRLAYLVVPEAIVDAVRAARAVTDRHPTTLPQGVLAEFIAEGHYARHLRRVRAVYAERQAALLDAAAGALDGLLSLAPDPAGLHLVGWLPTGVDDRVASDAARAEGIDAFALSNYRIVLTEPPAPGALLLGYAAFDRRTIRRAVARLARVLERVAVR